jgi:hypothetical protein
VGVVPADASSGETGDWCGMMVGETDGGRSVISWSRISWPCSSMPDMDGVLDELRVVGGSEISPFRSAAGEVDKGREQFECADFRSERHCSR